MGRPMDSAPKYAASGIPIFPVNGKHPLTAHGFYDATTDLALIGLWQEQYPEANIAIRTGTASRLLVLDIDDRHGGAKSLQVLEEEYGKLPETREARTGTGGRHLYFELAEGQIIPSSTGKLAPGLDIRAEGGYIVAWPSIHPETHQQYVWVNRLRPTPIPAWFAELLLKLTAPPLLSPAQPEALIGEGQRNATLTRIAGAMRRQGCSQEVIAAALLEANAKQCKPSLPEKEVHQIARSVARYEPAEPPRPNGPSTEVPSPQPPIPASGSGWPDALELGAFHALAGGTVQTIEPHTESSRAALLVQVLVCFGNMIGRSAYFVAEASRHYLNLFTVLVGVTAGGRKGSSWTQVLRVFNSTDAAWAANCIQSGLSSGEGLIYAVRDPVYKRMRQRDGSYELEEVDAGVSDKRLLVFESEFASTLRMMGRDGNILDVVMRQAWDGTDLRTLTKNSPTKASNAHISFIGHITKDELRREITATEKANGFANRFLWVCTARSKELPEGGNLDDAQVVSFARRFGEAAAFAQTVTEMKRDPAIKEMWREVYHQVTTPTPGLFGAVISRAAPLIMRLACIYALLDQSPIVRAEHLRAAIAVWKYCQDSAKFVFGEALGDPTADAILAALRTAPEGLDRTAISGLFGRHKNAAEIARALAVLQEHGLAEFHRQAVGDNIRPTETWSAIGAAANYANYAN